MEGSLTLRAFTSITEKYEVRVVDDYTRKVHYMCAFCGKTSTLYETLGHEDTCIVLEIWSFLKL